MWSPYLLKDIDLVENVQRSFTRRIPGQRQFSYPDRLANLDLPSLEERRIVADLVFLHKLVYGHVNMRLM